MREHRTHILPAHLGEMIKQIGPSVVYAKILEIRAAPPGYTWYRFFRVVQKGMAHQFEITMLEQIYYANKE